MTLPITPVRVEPRGAFPAHTPVELLPVQLRQALTGSEARRRARRRLNDWLEAHGRPRLPEVS